MLIRFNHGQATWPSHTSFLAYKRRMAARAGLDLDEMEGFGGTVRWSRIKDDLEPFLSMPDVVGSIRVKDCVRVARRLRALADAMAPDDPDREPTLQLADGVGAAALMLERFRFRR